MTFKLNPPETWDPFAMENWGPCCVCGELVGLNGTCASGGPQGWVAWHRGGASGKNCFTPELKQFLLELDM